MKISVNLANQRSVLHWSAEGAELRERLKRKAHILIPPHKHGSTETDERSCGVRAASKAAILLTKQSLRKTYSFCDITAVTN